ncbi:MAG: M20/M25/M40 family metallo-hydrolase, partial [Bacteroidetes bacterium]|nr:M20/M25/M40 family metallo-hydrolase [Bacteroidota bacterium]
RQNIIPEEVKMIGTIRTLDEGTHKQVHERIRQIATKIAESAGATAEVQIDEMYPVTYNDPELTQEMVPSLQEVAGSGKVVVKPAVTGAEDFSFFQKEVPGFFFFLGGMPKGKKIEEAAPHHTPDFYIDESGMLLGVKALSRLTIDYMNKHAVKQ